MKLPFVGLLFCLAAPLGQSGGAAISPMPSGFEQVRLGMTSPEVRAVRKAARPDDFYASDALLERIAGGQAFSDVAYFFEEGRLRRVVFSAEVPPAGVPGRCQAAFAMLQGRAGDRYETRIGVAAKKIVPSAPARFPVVTWQTSAAHMVLQCVQSSSAERLAPNFVQLTVVASDRPFAEAVGGKFASKPTVEELRQVFTPVLKAALR